MYDHWPEPGASVAAAATAFWARHALLPAAVKPADRAREICASAWLGDELVGVATAHLDIVPQLRARFAFFRCAVAPAHRRHSVSRKLAGRSRQLLEAYYAEHPEDEVKGMAAVAEAHEMNHLAKPTLSASRLSLIGYTAEGRQLRVAWFQHARVP